MQHFGRRQLCTHAAAAAALIVLPPGRAAMTVGEQVELGPPTMEDAAALWENYPRVDVQATAAVAARHLGRLAVQTLGRTPPKKAVRDRQVLAATIGAARGQALADAGRYKDARAVLAETSRTALLAGHRVLVEHIRATRALVELYAGDPDRALVIIGRHRDLVDATRARLLTLTARAWAMRGDSAVRTRAALQMARVQLDNLNVPIAGSPGVGTFSRADWAAAAVDAYGRAGLHEESAEAMREVLVEADAGQITSLGVGLRSGHAVALVNVDTTTGALLLAEAIQAARQVGTPAAAVRDRAARFLRAAPPGRAGVSDLRALARDAWPQPDPANTSGARRRPT